MSQDNDPLDNFPGTARLFPLPNLVLFPHVAQPLHVFEPRYRQLMADCLDDDRLMALALLRAGWEEDYHKRPSIHPTVCVGRVLQEERLPDGRYNLLLQGLSRARVVEEVSTDRLYRVARVELVQDVEVDGEAAESSLRSDLGKGVEPYFATHPPAREQLQKLLRSGMPLGSLCDIFSFALPLEVEVKQSLLEEACVERRARALLRALQGMAAAAPVASQQPAKRKFPPEFSLN